MTGLKEAGTMETATDKRKGLLALVHIAAKSLYGEDKLTYRQDLWRWFGVTSAADLNEAQLGQLVDIYKLNGWKPSPGRETREKKRERNRASHAQMGMIHGLWRELARTGRARNPTDDGLRRFVKKASGVDRVEWLTIAQAGCVIEALKAWRKRAKDSQCVTPGRGESERGS